MTAKAAEQRWLAWQTVDTGRLALMSVTSTLVIVAVTRTAMMPLAPTRPVAIAFGLYIAFGELLRLALPGGREAAPIAMSAALSYAMVLRIAGPPHQLPVYGAPPLQVVLVAAVGMVLGSLPHIAAGRRAGITGMSARLVAVACVAFIFHPLIKHLLDMPWLAFVTMAVFGAEVMGIAELAVFAGPLLVIQFAFRRYAGIRLTYLQTVRALAQVTEVGGYVESGHSWRVSRLALAIGRELGMPEPDLLDLEYAALMHDIGQLSLVEPIPGGATLLVSPPKRAGLPSSAPR